MIVGDAPLPIVSVVVRTADDPHEDLAWVICGEEFICDGYYMAIDPEYERRWSTLSAGEFMRRALADLLSQWEAQLDTLRGWDVIYLPFAWWDQGSQFVRCRAERDRGFVAVVNSELEGHQFWPSDISPVTRGEHCPQGVHLAETEVPLARLRQEIRRARERLLNG